MLLLACGASMRLKLYRAGGMAEAMAKVRSELGAEAMILGSRRVAGGVEITAALEPEDALPLPLLASLPAPVRLNPARLAALRFHGVPDVLQRALMPAGDLADALDSILTFGTLDLTAGSRPVLLCGPPGAGKTLTAARLATRLVMGGAVPMVITADGRRAGAAEQLAAFTRLLGVNLIVASHPVTLARALSVRPLDSPVLIDAPGIDPFDPMQREEIAALAATANAVLALVLPAGLDPAEAMDVSAAFIAAGATSLIATRLDMARRLGGVLAAAGRLTLTEAGIGPGAADGLVAMTPALLAARLTVMPSLAAEFCP
jgi:flagellar biosynthesis protein FlhF